MYFDQGSFTNYEEPMELEDDSGQDFDHDFFVNLDCGQPPGNCDFDDFQGHLSNSNFVQVDFATSPDESAFSPSQRSSNDPSPSISIENQPRSNEFNNVYDVCTDNSCIKDNLFDNPPQSPFQNFSLKAQPNMNNFNYHSSGNAFGIPSSNNNSNNSIFSMQQQMINQKNYPNLPYHYNLNWNSASEIPLGTNVSNQNAWFQNFSNSNVNRGNLFNGNQNIFTDLNNNNLSISNDGCGWGCKAARSCQSSSMSKFDKFLEQMVLQNQEKIGKELKVIIFNFFREYLSNDHQELAKILRPLSRDELRSVKLVSKRLFLLKDHIYHSFRYQNKETLVPIVERYNEHVLKNHKRKGIKNAKKNLDLICSIKENQEQEQEQEQEI
ncbi:hypothetical protein M9Y10_013601 [Tritrichomonas musculus]|uniref:F-box domain-containing protein n=1 Tax=Tritrichomonas musculus TaxID=1915356 RepID=A0ABR2KX98_9EUKA